MAVSTLRPPGLEPDSYSGSSHRDASASPNFNLPSSSVTASDVFSLTDDELKERLHFIKEIGYGNWGSVWACFTKDAPTREKVAVKLVHREKTPTTAARVRSLWNEMKIHRAFKEDTHPSIVRFHSFVITPSFALITMEYLPKLIPVEVKEAKAKPWFYSLLGGVHFLHTHGVTHNDIKPANILLSHSSVPVLVDFGFAEKTSLNPTSSSRRKGPGPFLSNLAYGTPEYLPPERARGLLHDTRLSDIYSLGVTFFEILVGRTPFEFSGEDGAADLCTEEQLEAYYQRTKAGRWLGEGEWCSRLSVGAERLIRLMTDPVAERRPNTQALLESEYWQMDYEPAVPVHEIVAKTQSTSVNLAAPTVTFTAASPQSKRVAATHQQAPKIQKPPVPPRSISPIRARPAAKSHKAVPGVSAPKQKSTPVACVHPPRAPRSAIPRVWKEQGKENTNKTYSPGTTRKAPARKPIPAAVFKDSGFSSNTLPTRSSTTSLSQRAVVKDKDNTKNRNGRVLVDLTGVNGVTTKKKADTKPISMLRVETPPLDAAPKPVLQVVREMKASMMAAKLQREKEQALKEAESTDAEGHDIPTELFPNDAHTRTKNDSVPVSTIIKHGLKTSMDKLGKVSAVVVGGNRRSSRHSIFETRDSLDGSVVGANQSKGRRESTPIPVLTEEAPGCDSVVEEVERIDRMDRLTSWIRDVEKVVEETRSSFQKSEENYSPPSLIPAPSQSSPRSLSPSTATSRRAPNPRHSVNPTSVPVDFVKRRRATVGGPFSPALAGDRSILEAISALDSNGAVNAADSNSKPSTDRSPTKARSQGALNVHIPGILRSISPVAKLQLQLDQELESSQSPPNPQRLSAVIDPAELAAEMNKIDRSAPSISLADTSKDIPSIEISRTSDSFDTSRPSSPLVIKAKPVDQGKPRLSTGIPSAASIDVLSNMSIPTIVSSSASNLAPRSDLSGPQLINPANSKEVEGVYDRFLMATSSVVRLGRGYQSDYSIRKTAAHQTRPNEKSPTPSKDDLKSKKKSLFRGPSSGALRPKTNVAKPTATKSHDDLGIRKLGIKKPGMAKSGTENVPVPEGTTVKGRVKKAFQAILATPSVKPSRTVNRAH
ncbi:hypothetical protein FRC02_003598 [Tulasnella sp. 418]|nr:hypothetical protein FRC02_003598 [Tulasnella sp. 418]